MADGRSRNEAPQKHLTISENGQNRHKNSAIPGRGGAPNQASSAACLSGLQHAPQQLDILGDRGVRLAQFLDLSHGVHDGRVVAAAKFPADFG